MADRFGFYINFQGTEYQLQGSILYHFLQSGKLQYLFIITFSERTQYDLSGTLKYFAQTATDFLLPSAENKKMSHF